MPQSWRVRWLRLAACVYLAVAGVMPAAAQVPSDGLVGARVAEVAVVLRPMPPDPQVARNLEGSVRKAFGVYPGDRYDATRLEFGVSRVRGVAGVTDVDVAIEFAGVGGLRVVLTADLAAARGPKTLAQRVRLVDDGERLVKLDLAFKGALPISGNQWFGNGPTLTEFSPYGRFTAGNGPNTAYDGAVKVGVAAALPVVRGQRPLYAYGHVTYLVPAIAGQANGTADAKVGHGFEEAYVGVVGGGATAAGTAWSYNVSFGAQPFCIGGAMFLCQVASSGGERAGDFSWPRWTAHNTLRAQFRLRNTTVEGFHLESNDFPSTGTRLAGLNLQHDPGIGLGYGATWFTTIESSLRYFFPDGSEQTRDGMRGLHIRAAYTPPPAGGPIVKAEFGRQTNAHFAMDARGGAVEGGWSFGRVKARPSLTYRFTATSGDDPETAEYERWDLLHSGGDIDTWVQGVLLKNLHYNSNVQMHRVLARLLPRPRWRFTTAFSTFRASTENNLGGVLATVPGRSLGRELLIVSEYTLSRHLYVRVTQGTLWAGSGVRASVPDPVSSPWLVGIASLNVQY
jgi:hypothetical protein